MYHHMETHSLIDHTSPYPIPHDLQEGGGR